MGESMGAADVLAKLKQVGAGLADHERGCEGRNYTCDCGYDEEVQTVCKDAYGILGALLKKQEWQPIAGAPKDGTAVLVAARPDPENVMIVVAWWNVERERWGFGNHKVLITEPTVWQPLPSFEGIPHA